MSIKSRVNSLAGTKKIAKALAVYQRFSNAMDKIDAEHRKLIEKTLQSVKRDKK